MGEHVESATTLHFEVGTSMEQRMSKSKNAIIDAEAKREAQTFRLFTSRTASLANTDDRDQHVKFYEAADKEFDIEGGVEDGDEDLYYEGLDHIYGIEENSEVEASIVELAGAAFTDRTAVLGELFEDDFVERTEGTKEAITNAFGDY